MDESQNFETPKGDFPWQETDLATRFGVDRDELKFWRMTSQPGTDWALVKNRVCYSSQMAKDAALALGLQLETLTWLWPEKPADLPVVELRVVSIKTMNPHIIIASNPLLHPNEQCRLRVRVKKKDNFRFGMMLKATHVSADLYELAGNCPRFPGKY